MSHFRFAELNTLKPLVAAAVLAWGLPAQAVTLNGSAAPATTPLGGATMVTINLDLSGPIDLLGLTLTLDWPSAGLAFNPMASTALGQSWASFAASFDPDFSSVSSGPGTFGASVLLLAPLSVPAGPSTMSFAFTGLAVGPQTVSYSVDLTDLTLSPLFVQGSAAVNVVAVPEPHPALMLAAGVAVLGLLSRRRRP